MLTNRRQETSCKYLLRIGQKELIRPCIEVLTYRMSMWEVLNLWNFQSSSSSYICHGDEPLVDPFRSHVSRSLFKGLPWFLLPGGEQCFITLGNLLRAILKHTGPESKGSNPTTGLTLLWARNPFRGNFNHWQVSRKEAGHIFFKRRHGCETFS